MCSYKKPGTVVIWTKNKNGDTIKISGLVPDRKKLESIKSLKKKKRKKKYKKQKAKYRKNRKLTAKKAFYKSHEWALVRYEALKRSNGRCELCGRGKKEGIILNVDHIKPRHKYPKLELDINNLQVLCSSCNWGKWGNDETDWRKDNVKRENEKIEGKTFFKSSAWVAARNKAIVRSRRRCEVCSRTEKGGAVLIVRHIKSMQDHPELGLAVGNLQALCKDCYIKMEKLYKEDRETGEKWAALIHEGKRGGLWPIDKAV